MRTSFSRGTLLRHERDHRTDRHRSEHHTDRSTRDRQGDAFGDLLERHPAPTTAQRGSDGEVPAACRPPHQQEKGRVCASNGEQQHGRDKRGAQGRCRVAGEPCQEGRDFDVVTIEGVHQRVHLRPGGGRGDARLEPRKPVQALARRNERRIFGPDRQWQEDLVLVEPGKCRSGRKDADDGRQRVLHLYRTAENAGVRSHLAAPEAIGDDRYRCGAGTILGQLESAPLTRGDSERGEETGAHAGDRNQRRTTG
jgi:hypothetical protein